MLKTFLRRQHPSYDILSLLADGELSASETMTVNAHLAECRDCREEVDFMVDLRGRLQALTAPTPPRSTLPDILGARAMGERRILDFSDEPEYQPARAFVRAAAPVAAMVGLVAVSFAMFAAGSVEAGSSSLDFDIEAAGQPFDIEFNTSGRLAGAERATVVASTFERFDPVWRPRARSVEATILRRRAGTFSGSMSLPSSASFARFEVRGPERVSDPAGGRTFLARRADGQPTFDALANHLWFQFEAGEVPDGPALQQLVDLYGDNPYAWWLRRQLEELSGTADAAARARDVARLEEFGRDLSRAPGDVAGGVVAFAMSLDWDPAAEDRTSVDRVGREALSRLRDVAPSHPELIEVEAWVIAFARWGDWTGQLAEFEGLWARHGSGSQYLFDGALAAAVYAGDGRAVVRWIDRWLAVDPDAVGEIVVALEGTLETVTGPVPEGLITRVQRLLDEYERRFAPSDNAPIRLYEAFDAGRAQALDLVGALLERDGRLEEAHQARRAATEAEPTHDRFLRAAEVALRLERPEEAARFLASAFELTDDDADRASIEVRLTTLPLAASDLARIRDEARADVRARIFTDDRIRPSGAIEVRNRYGRLVDFRDHLGSDATLVFFVEARYPASLPGAEALVSQCARLHGRGIALRVVTDDVPPPELLRLLDRADCGEVIFVDAPRRLRRAYNAPLLGQALVLSGEGELFYRDSELGEALLRARILAEGQ